MDSFMMRMANINWDRTISTLRNVSTEAGSDHRKFLRQVFVSVDVTAPLYWWKEYDTYKVATVANSTSTMQNASKPFSMDDFSCDHMTAGTRAFMETVIAKLEKSACVIWETRTRMTGMI